MPHLEFRNVRGTTIFVLYSRHHQKIPPKPCLAMNHLVLVRVVLLPRNKVGMSTFLKCPQNLRHWYTRATLRLDQEIVKGCLGSPQETSWNLSTLSASWSL